MLSQLKLALRVLKRRKFFTFISLFGISFTILALVIVAAMGDAALGDNAPFSKRDELITATRFRAEQVLPDTTYLIDSALVGGVMTYDSTMQIGEEVSQDNNGMLSYMLYDKHLRDLDGTIQSSYAAPTADFNTYLNGRKVELSANYTDAQFFEILNFDFVAGAPYNASQVEASERVVVLSDYAARDYFGHARSELIDRRLPVGEKDYRIVGIVKRPGTTTAGVASDLFLPVTTAGASFLDPTSYQGGGMGIFLAADGAGRDRIKASLAEVADGLQALPDDEEKNRFHIEGLTFTEEIAARYYGDPAVNRDAAFGKFFGPVLVLLAMLILLPAINLANVNLSRVFERAPEIAVRKSFGATDGDILRQFLVETLVITVIGGLIGVLFSFGVIAVANTQEWFDGIRLAFTPEVALYTLAIILVFGLITGLAPAYRLAQTRIATSLR